MNSIKITTCPAEDLEQVRTLLSNTSQKPYRYLVSEYRSELDDFWLRELASSIQDGEGELLLALESGQIVGMVVLAPLPWESRITGKPMGVLKHLLVDASVSSQHAIADHLLHEASLRAQNQGMHALLCKTYTDDMPAIHALEDQGYRLMDTLLDFVYDYRRYPLGNATMSMRLPGSPPEAKFRLAEDKDELALLSVAQAAFAGHFGRFHADERISTHDATQIYVEWIRSCLSGYAEWILVAEIGGQVVGYTAWKKPTELEQNLPVRVGHYSIAGIHPDYGGRGLFSSLTYQGMQLLEGHVDLIEGPTHINNYPVQRGYANLRWRILDARHAFHKWLTTDA